MSIRVGKHQTFELSRTNYIADCQPSLWEIDVTSVLQYTWSVVFSRLNHSGDWSVLLFLAKLVSVSRESHKELRSLDLYDL